MEIRSYELFAVPPRWLLLKLETSDGTVGWGEPSLQGRSKSVRAAVEELVERYLIGADPRRTEHVWRRLHQSGYFRGGPVLLSALSGIDQALWDIKGRHHGCPVYDLLGGHVRERMLVYAWVGGETPARMAEEAQTRVDHGFQAIKLNLPPSEFRHLETLARTEDIVDHVAAVREAVGEDVLVGVDFHGRVRRPMVSRLIDLLEPYQPMFVDQPTLPEHDDNMPGFAARTNVPLSTGERHFTRYEFKPLLVDGGAAVIQPDVTHAGGITELDKIAAMADAFDVAVVPHSPLSPVAFAASLQVDFAAHNAVLQEQDLTLPTPESSTALQYLQDPTVFEFEDGYVERPEGDGLGIEVDEDHVRERSTASVNWRSPEWYYEDESLAEW